jgi:hypothetical protein
VRLGGVTLGVDRVRIAVAHDAADAGRVWCLGVHALLVPDAALAHAVDLPAILTTSDGDAVWLQMDAPLDAVARRDLPVFLVRAPGASIEAWLAAADRIRSGGNHQVVLVAQSTDGILDLAGLADLPTRTASPVVVDLRGLGDPQKLEAATLAAGASGVVIAS